MDGFRDDPMWLLSEAGPIAKRLGERYEARREQVDMAVAVDQALDKGEHLCVEAGTGVGKSFAYLLPALRYAVGDPDQRRKVVISTDTIALQEQLMDKDLPLLRAVLPWEFTAIKAIGRGNYVSRRRLKRAYEKRGALFDASQSMQQLDMLVEWASDSQEGTRMSLTQQVSGEVWAEVQSDREDCLGSRCPHAKECYFQQARARLRAADVLVVNHALFFADLAMREDGGGVLPEYEAVVLDEAHTVEGVASDHFGLKLSRYQVAYALGRLQGRRGKGFLERADIKKAVGLQLIERVEARVEKARLAAERLFADLATWRQTKAPSNGRVSEPNFIENGLTEPLNQVATAMRLVDAQLDEIEDKLEAKMLADRISSIALACEQLIALQVSDSVTWVEMTQGRRPRLTIYSVPIEVAPILAEKLFRATTRQKNTIPVVLTSATLAVAASSRGADPLQHLKGRLGADGDAQRLSDEEEARPVARSLVLGSPFDYSSQVLLKLYPNMAPPVGEQREQFRDQLESVLLRTLQDSDGGAFVLFTNYVLLREMAARLFEPCQAHGWPLLVQGQDLSRKDMLARFRDSGRAVLLGADSFWQGVDVPGRALRRVVMTQLPFQVPDEPIIQARCERITKRGGNAFVEYSLPEAILMFKQGFGRLVRSQTDTGEVIFTDSRIVTKFYGRRFLQSLPAVPITQVGE